jgi:Regulator of ribonuclease activity B
VIEAFLYFTGEGPARRVAAQLEEGGYRTYVDPNPPGRWLLEAVSRAVPTPEHIAGMSTSLRRAASSNNGIYDGWWASEPPEEEEGGLIGVALEEDPQGGQHDDLQVQPEGPVLDVIDVVEGPVADGGGSPEVVDLGPTG